NVHSIVSDVRLFFFSSRRRHTRSTRDWSSDVCSSDLEPRQAAIGRKLGDREIDGAVLSFVCDSALQQPRDERDHRRHVLRGARKIGRASCRERVQIEEGGGSVKQKRGMKTEEAESKAI